MRVIINAPARADDPDGVAAEIIFSDAPNLAVRRRINRRITRRENVLTFVLAVAAARCAEGVGYLFVFNCANRNVDFRFGFFGVKRGVAKRRDGGGRAGNLFDVRREIVDDEEPGEQQRD